jgi:hypothetical protein
MMNELVINMDLVLDWQLRCLTVVVVVVVEYHNQFHNMMIDAFDVDDIVHVQFPTFVLEVHVNRESDDYRVEL